MSFFRRKTQPTRLRHGVTYYPGTAQEIAQFTDHSHPFSELVRCMNCGGYSYPDKNGEPTCECPKGKS
jgi:hypothetical protein